MEPIFIAPTKSTVTNYKPIQKKIEILTGLSDLSKIVLNT